MYLPKIYDNFIQRVRRNIPSSLVGTDLVNSNFDLKEAAIQLLHDNNIVNFLTDDDFVFMMHQGYIFWYFTADGSPDPQVHGFSEEDKFPRDLGPLSAFLKQYS